MIPPILIINRASDGARLAHVRAQLASAGLRGERVDAVEGSDVPDQLRAQFFDASGAPLSNMMVGEVGCYASHLKVAQCIVDRGWNHALVIEDDITFERDFVAALKGAMQSLPEDWDILRLSSTTKRAVLSLGGLPSQRHLVRYSRLPKQTGAYLISNSGARKLLAPRKRVRPVDADLRYAWNFGLDTYGVSPSPVCQDGFHSTIRAPGRRRRDARGGRWKAPGPASRIVGCAYMLKTLGARGWIACAKRNIALKAAAKLNAAPSGNRQLLVPAINDGA